MDIRKMSDEELIDALRTDFYRLNKNCYPFVDIAKFIRLCVEDSMPELLSKERIRNILYADDTIDPLPPFRSLPLIDKTVANVKAERIFEAQQALASVEGKDSHVA